MKKIITIFLALALTINTSFAILPVIDGALIGVTTANGAIAGTDLGLSFIDNVKNFALEPFTYMLAQKVKDQLKKQIVSWIQGGGKGKPQFLDNPERFFTNLATQQLTVVKRDILNSAVGNDQVLKALVAGNAEGVAQKIFQNTITPNIDSIIKSDICTQDKLKSLSGGDATKEAQLKAQYCDNKTSTSSKQQQYNDLQNCFAKDFSCGGWNAFLAITQNPYQNTETGRLTVAQLQLSQKVEQKTTATNNELSRGGGFFNQKVCKKYYGTEKDDDGNVIPENQRVCAEYEVQTPGQQLSQLTSDVLNDPLKQLQNVQKISQVILTVLAERLFNQGVKSGLKYLSGDALTNSIRSSSSTDNATNLRDSVAAAGKPADPTVNSTSITLSDAEHRNYTSQMLQLMKKTLTENDSNINIVTEELNRYQSLADKIAQIELCYRGKAWLQMPQIVKNTIDSKKQEVGSKVLSLADEYTTYKGKSDDLAAAIETITKSRDGDAISNIFNAYNAELSANSYLTQNTADKRRQDDAELFKQLDDLATTFDSMLTECQQAQPETGGGN